MRYIDFKNEDDICVQELNALKDLVNNNNFELRSLGKWSHFFKPKEYEIENEARVLFQQPDNQSDGKKWLITSDYSIINPYCEFELFNESTPFVLKLKEIIIGFNCPQSETNKMQLNALLFDKKTQGIKISFSNIKSFR